MKYGPSDQILSFVKNRFIYQKVEKLQFRIKTLRKWQTTKIPQKNHESRSLHFNT